MPSWEQCLLPLERANWLTQSHTHSTLIHVHSYRAQRLLDLSSTTSGITGTLENCHGQSSKKLAHHTEQMCRLMGSQHPHSDPTLQN